ncbi:MAG: DUF1211 domain-containing protein [Chloroflexi bacterium]|nr:MAG: DUF1211 domain-containing protein [Chloroflexota bacterium]
MRPHVQPRDVAGGSLRDGLGELDPDRRVAGEYWHPRANRDGDVDPAGTGGRRPCAHVATLGAGRAICHAAAPYGCAVESPEQPDDIVSSARLETFADGVFAIAITLLVLEIHIPEAGENVGKALLGQWPSFLAYVTSFLTIGTIWADHHRLFTVIRGTTYGFLFVNVLLLMPVAFLPYPTAVVARQWFEGKDQVVPAMGVVWRNHGLSRSHVQGRVALRRLAQAPWCRGRPFARPSPERRPDLSTRAVDLSRRRGRVGDRSHPVAGRVPGSGHLLALPGPLPARLARAGAKIEERAPHRAVPEREGELPTASGPGRIGLPGVGVGVACWRVGER